MERGLRIGVIGTGQIGRLHARLLATRVPRATVVAVADIDRSAAELCAAENNVPQVYDDHSKLFDTDIDAVVIATPGWLHAGQIEAAARHGKHCFTEKPLDCDLASIDRALGAVADAGIVLQVGFNRRFDSNFTQARAAIASGGVGRPFLLHITSFDPVLPARNDEGIPAWLFFDTTIHDFDMARHLIGEDVTEVRALTGSFVHDNGVIDTATVVLRFAGGAIATIDNSQATYGYDQRLEVLGSGGGLTVGNEALHRVTLHDSFGAHAVGPLTFFAERYIDSYIAELSSFVACVLDGGQSPVTGAEGRAAVVIALAAQRSHLEDGRPVAISEIDLRVD
jgi:myo-inositol 2-dehydrogenase/D-chiro-inositol 1-dehydrogenase